MHTNPETNETFKSFAEASAYSEKTGRHLPVDRGKFCSPRYIVELRPVVGDAVSRSFNGDTYPAGVIVSISKTFKKISTDDGTTFYRNRAGGWKARGMWWLVRGHRNERNPHF